MSINASATAIGRVGRYLALGLLLSLSLLAGPTIAADDGAQARIVARLKQARPDFEVSSVVPSDIPGIFEVQLAGGPLIYSTADGEYFLLGDLFQVQSGGLVNLAEQRRDQDRVALLDAIDEKDMIVFAAEGETRATITVFTDVDCFYCQKLHKEVPELNRRGIAVRYLAYPRAGVGSESYRKIASAWCADDPQTAITTLKNKGTVKDNVCADNPVADQFLLGQQMGVRGTPALVLDNGSMIPGYVSADDLSERLGIN